MHLSEAKKRIDDFINSEIAQGEITGANFLVMHKGEPLFQGSYGYADITKTKPMREDTIFRIFSLTKPITAAAVLKLFEEGNIDLWDSVSDYLPGFQNQNVLASDNAVYSWELKPVYRELTLWDLLTMTSGIPYPGPECESGKRMKRLFDNIEERRRIGEKVTTVEIANEIGTIPLQFQPGKHWMYGASADILGAVIEIVTGKNLFEYLNEAIFEPLNMTDTGFFVPQEKKERFAQFSILNQDNILIPYTGNDFGMEGYEKEPSFQSAGAGLVSTIKDYANFTQMLVNGGTWMGKKILGRKTTELLRQNHLTKEQQASFNWYSTIGYGYGCLVRVLTDQGLAATNASLGEYGWDGWSGTYASIDPAEDITLLYFIQRAGSGMTPIVRKLRAVTYGTVL